MNNVLQLKPQPKTATFVDVDYSHGRIYLSTCEYEAAEIIDMGDEAWDFHWESVIECDWFENGGFFCATPGEQVAYESRTPTFHNDCEYRAVRAA